VSATDVPLYIATGAALASGTGIPIYTLRRARKEREAATRKAEFTEEVEKAKVKDVVTAQSLMADIRNERNDLRAEVAELRRQLAEVDGHYRQRIREVEQEADRVATEARRRVTALEAEMDALRRQLPPQ